MASGIKYSSLGWQNNAAHLASLNATATADVSEEDNSKITEGQTTSSVATSNLVSQALRSLNPFFGLYDPVDRYQRIDAAEAHTDFDAIKTVLSGKRPLCSVSLSEKEISALKKIDGICIQLEPRPPCKNVNISWVVYRKGSEKLLSRYLDVMDKLYKQWGKDLDNVRDTSVRQLQRLLEFHRDFGEIYHYTPESIAAFGNKVEQRLRQELSSVKEKTDQLVKIVARKFFENFERDKFF